MIIKSFNLFSKLFFSIKFRIFVTLKIYTGRGLSTIDLNLDRYDEIQKAGCA